MQAMSPVSGEDDSTTDGVPSDEEEEEEKEEGPVEREGRCEKTLREANALSKRAVYTSPSLQHAENVCFHSSGAEPSDLCSPKEGKPTASRGRPRATPSTGRPLECRSDPFLPPSF